MFTTISPAQLEAAYAAATGGLAPHHVARMLGTLTNGLPLDRLQALHAAALGRPLVPEVLPVRSVTCAGARAFREG